MIIIIKHVNDVNNNIEIIEINIFYEKFIVNSLNGKKMILCRLCFLSENMTTIDEYKYKIIKKDDYNFKYGTLLDKNILI